MLKELLDSNWLPSADAETLEQSCPEKLFFLQEEFIRKYYAIAQLPQEQLDFVIQKAAEFDERKEIRLLCWYMYHKFSKTHIRSYQPFPEFIFQLGYDSGILYLLIGLSVIPEYEARAERENFPMRYAHDAASRFGTYPTYFAQAFEGRFGIRARSLHFMLHFKDSHMYRIGRFDFVIEQVNCSLPHVYTRNGELLLFCRDNWRMDKRGERLSPAEKPQQGEWVAKFSDDGEIVRGYPINTARGFAELEEIAVPRKELKLVASVGDWVLHVHIPAGGKMTPEVCRSSCKEALEFFAEKYPDKPVKMILTWSWIANDAWLDYIPNSNMAVLIRASAIFPSVGSPVAGLYFVFGREDSNFSTYPRTNSLERAVLDSIADGRPLRAPGMIYLPLP